MRKILWALIIWPFMTTPYNTFSTAQLFSSKCMHVIYNSDNPLLDWNVLQKSISPRPWVKSNKSNKYKIISIVMKFFFLDSYLQYLFITREKNLALMLLHYLHMLLSLSLNQCSDSSGVILGENRGMQGILIQI